MEGANYERLAQGLDEMKAWYTGLERQFATHLLLFEVFLDRSTMVNAEDKRRIKKKMTDSYSFLDESSFVQERKAQAKEEGKQEGLQEGLQTALVAAVEERFPDLKELAQQKAILIDKPDTLTIILRGVIAAPDEKTARFVLDKLAA